MAVEEPVQRSVGGIRREILEDILSFFADFTAGVDNDLVKMPEIQLVPQGQLSDPSDSVDAQYFFAFEFCLHLLYSSYTYFLKLIPYFNRS
ncbi:hypothetical protein SDC9_212538 [bioreactor metagenome]|uniref:Uncharacterized protein n=1 Tax=bioreactor metagenome TaxID=1076179 RepID=A0A645JMA5_9ZZZZ